ncbi:recombinase family protein [Nocardia sp. X0981]
MTTPNGGAPSGTNASTTYAAATPPGRFLFHVIAAMDEMTADLISEGTLEGLESARARGRIGRRPPALTEQSHGQHDPPVAQPQSRNRLNRRHTLSSQHRCEDPPPPPDRPSPIAAPLTQPANGTPGQHAARNPAEH